MNFPLTSRLTVARKNAVCAWSHINCTVIRYRRRIWMYLENLARRSQVHLRSWIRLEASTPRARHSSDWSHEIYTGVVCSCKCKSGLRILRKFRDTPSDFHCVRGSYRLGRRVEFSARRPPSPYPPSQLKSTEKEENPSGKQRALCRAPRNGLTALSRWEKSSTGRRTCRHKRTHEYRSWWRRAQSSFETLVLISSDRDGQAAKRHDENVFHYARAQESSLLPSIDGLPSRETSSKEMSNGSEKYGNH